MTIELEKKLGNPSAAQVAKLARVSVFTVSRAFSGATVVSASTRERVFAAARKIGYAPHAAARALRTGKVETIALVQPARFMRGEFYCDILAGLQDSIGNHNLDVLLSSIPQSMSFEQWIRHLVQTGRCGALAILMKITEKEHFHMLSKLSIPVTIINSLPTECDAYPLSCAGFDNLSGVRQAVHHLYEIGHRAMAFFGCPSYWGDAELREEGFRQTMRELDIAAKPEWIMNFADGAAAGAEALDSLYCRGGQKPTAIICASDDVTLGALQASRRWGKSIPDDLSIVGFDDNLWTAYYTPAITTVRHKGWDLGMEAGNLLMERYDNPKLPPRKVILPTQLVVRQSTAPPRI